VQPECSLCAAKKKLAEGLVFYVIKFRLRSRFIISDEGFYILGHVRAVSMVTRDAF